MKLNSTVALTLVLLSLMVGAGVVSATWGIALGREALKGVTQPDTRPTTNLAKRQGNAARREEFAILREEDIVASAKARINGGAASKSAPASSGKTTTAPAKKPLVAQQEGVALEVKSVRRQGDEIVLEVNMRNGSDQTVQFLYSELSIINDQGREVSATTDGLPSDLPAASDTFSGTIAIPTKALGNSTRLSLSLPNYPDQDFQLELSDIPVPR